MARIIPVSSGKGGVGKTTFAIHYALMLSRYGRTVLVDLDMGTSSIRNSFNMNFDHDLYHFFRRDYPIESCITPLAPKLDPDQHYTNLGILASPRGLIEDLMNFNEEHKSRLIRAINSLRADYVILDLKAGLDARVLDFLPHANSGIIIFTPLVPSAVFAASEIVKALILRKLKALFEYDYFLIRSGLSPAQTTNYQVHVEAMEDVYEAREDNLEEFLALLQFEVQNESILAMIGNVIRDFKIYYVLNRFNSVTDSVEKIIRPFTESIHRSITPYLKIINLGWIVEDERFLKSATDKVPLLLQPAKEKSVSRKTHHEAMLHKWMADLKREFAPLSKPVRYKPAVSALTASPRKQAPAHDPLEQQLHLLRAMFDNQDRKDFRLNLDYITQRSLHLMRHGRFDDFGDTRLLGSLRERAEAISARWH